MSQPRSSSTGRSWIEGTLDVISGNGSKLINSRLPSSDPPQQGSVGGFLRRLPSQDSLDRSIHNDSGHGKSTLEIIRDLKQSNARLTARTAELEADFMNQLNQTTRKFEGQRKLTDERLAQKEKHVVMLESRCKSMEIRFREKDEQLTKLKEESAFQRHTISELKTQLFEMECAPASSNQNDNSRFAGGNEGYPGGNRPREALQKTGRALSEPQSQQKSIQEVEALPDMQSRNVPDRLRGHVSERDDTIAKLREQVLDYSAQLTELTGELSKFKSKAENQERYRREEADDLRVLNEAQEETIDLLRKQLEEAIHEVELREEELQEVNRQPEGSGMESDPTSDLHYQLGNAQELNRQLQLQVEKTRAESAKNVADMQAKIDDVECARSSNSTSRSLALAGESTEDMARVAALESEVQRLRSVATRSLHQSGGSLEEDLRKELRSTQVSRDKLRLEIAALKSSTEEYISELKSKLDDRDTTISALVKTSVTYEEQIESLQAEISSLCTGSGRGIGEEKSAEMYELRQLVENHRKMEDILTTDVSRLNNEVTASNQKIARLRAQHAPMKGKPVVALTDDQIIAREIQDRDDAISTLLKQSRNQDKLVSELQNQLHNVSIELESSFSSREASPSWEEVKQLREEAEVFAGQVIELDEEINALRAEVTNRDSRLVEFERELKNLRNRPSPAKADTMVVMNLKAEIDELREANLTQQNELRLLRRKARDVETLPDEFASVQGKLQEVRREVQTLKQAELVVTQSKERFEKQVALNAEAIQLLESEVKSAKQAKAVAEACLAKLQSELESQGSTTRQLEEVGPPTSKVDEFELDALRSNLARQSTAVNTAKETIRELERLLAEKSSSEASAYEEEKEELLAENDSLSKKLDEARQQLKSVEEERGIIEDFKQKLESADEAREESVKSIVDSYERKLSLLKLDKDITIDKLRKDLVEEKEVNAERLEEATATIAQYEMQIKDLKEDMEAQLKQRETRIYALEHTLEAQEQLVHNMRTEMDHLQGSMETTVAGRRKEVEDMQQELVDLTSANAKQDREIKALQAEIKQTEAEHKEEASRLESTIASLGDKTASEHRNASDLKMDLRVQEVKERLEKLKWLNTSLKEENQALRERLSKSEGNALIGERERAAAATMKVKIRGQDDRIKELESELEILKLHPILIPGPQHPVLPPSSANTGKKSPTRPKRGLLGRMRASSSDGAADMS
jgi:chromosome segregation ATPase